MPHRFRADADVRPLVGRNLDRLLRAAVAAAECSTGWGPGAEFCHEIDEPAFVAGGFERSAFVELHPGAGDDITLYHGSGLNPSSRLAGAGRDGLYERRRRPIHRRRDSGGRPVLVRSYHASLYPLLGLRDACRERRVN